MGRLIALACLGLLLVALAGCSGKGKDDDAGTSSSSSTTTTSSSSPTSAPNQAPTGALSVAVNGTQAVFSLTGSDPDGDALTWNLTFGDGASEEGTALPANVTHTYSAGNLTANLTISDGALSANYSVAVQAVAGAAAPEATTQTISGSYGFDNPACYGGPYDATPNDEPSGQIADYLTYLEVAVDPGTIGQPFVATFVSGAAMDTVLFVDADRATIESFTTGIGAGGVPGDVDWETEGLVPAGAVFVVFYGCGTLAGEAVDYTAGPAS